MGTSTARQIGVCRAVLGTLQKHCRGGIDASRRRNVPFFRTVRRKRTVYAGGMNASPTAKRNVFGNLQTPICRSLRVGVLVLLISI